jgi:hypothetical protein
MEKVARIFRSFEEADAADALERSRMDPRERMAIFFAIRERAHPDAAEQGLARICRVLELEQS